MFCRTGRWKRCCFADCSCVNLSRLLGNFCPFSCLPLFSQGSIHGCLTLRTIEYFSRLPFHLRLPLDTSCKKQTACGARFCSTPGWISQSCWAFSQISHKLFYQSRPTPPAMGVSQTVERVVEDVFREKLSL